MPKQYSVSKSATKEKSDFDYDQQKEPTTIKENNTSEKLSSSPTNLGKKQGPNKDTNIKAKTRSASKEEEKEVEKPKEKEASPMKVNLGSNFEEQSKDVNLRKRKTDHGKIEEEEEIHPPSKKFKPNEAEDKEKMEIEETKEKMDIAPPPPEIKISGEWKCSIDYSASRTFENGAKALIAGLRTKYPKLEIVPNKLEDKLHTFDVFLKKGTEEAVKVISKDKGDIIPTKKNVDRFLHKLAAAIGEDIKLYTPSPEEQSKIAEEKKPQVWRKGRGRKPKEQSIIPELTAEAEKLEKQSELGSRDSVLLNAEINIKRPPKEEEDGDNKTLIESTSFNQEEVDSKSPEKIETTQVKDDDKNLTNEPSGGIGEDLDLRKDNSGVNDTEQRKLTLGDFPSSSIDTTSKIEDENSNKEINKPVDAHESNLSGTDASDSSVKIGEFKC